LRTSTIAERVKEAAIILLLTFKTNNAHYQGGGGHFNH
jgi:hypothetical protein